MKKIDLQNWEKNEHFSKLLLFVQTITESTFWFSFESYRYPALNCHALAYEVFRAADDIEQKILMDGSFIPIAEEFELMINEDPFLKVCLGNSNVLLFSKGKNLDYYDNSKQDLKTKIRTYKGIANYINDKCESVSYYVDYLIYSIANLIFGSEDSISTREEIYKLTRMYVTELVNYGYSQEFIYETTEEYFFGSSKTIKCNRDTLVDFFKYFVLDSFEFKFKFRISAKLVDVFDQLDNFEIGDLSSEELRLLNCQKKASKCVILKVEDYDCFSAHKQALDKINLVLSLHKLNQHNSNLFVSRSAICTRLSDDDNHSIPFVVNKEINVMKKRGNTSYLHALYNDVFLHNSDDLPATIMRAVTLHNVAIECNDVTNQLLNLWTIIEVLITTKRDNEDRINTICNVLSQVLNRDYLYSNIEQLLKDIENCVENDLSSIFHSVGNSELNEVEKMCLILSVDNYETERNSILSMLDDYPLLQFRIQFFSEIVFKDSLGIYNYIHRHTKRIQWHIMRIYRNRNMIVHNSSHMFYIKQIVENLHFYVDTLISTLIEYSIIGFSEESNIFREIGYSEAYHFESLGVSIMNRKEKPTPILLTEENALNLILNGYSGNQYKKALDKAINEKIATKASKESNNT